ncbi:ATP-binding protein [Vreelandella neptunia]|uniref:ATP-binding protein n=1 Tax=Vreelandella neptunia TaxID=115551 RepID=UPI003159D90F
MQNNEDFIREKRELEKRKDFQLIQNIEESKSSGKVTEADLTTDEKVLARVTDGIYRQPASAIRELISNAYDADAENVWIDTDVPRFKNIVVRDNGNGMSSAELTNLIHHIGGSAKRDESKQHLQVSNSGDSKLSPKKKRKLIGKIGIGLFSVAQLTREFYITTKKEGDEYYLEAYVVLHNYSDTSEEKDYESRGQSFSAGKVKIRAIPTNNVNDHGTSIFLKNIKESARNQLRSTDVWALDADEQNFRLSDQEQREPKVRLPNFHIGSIKNDEQDIISRQASLPWDESDEPDQRFSRLYSAMIELAGKTVSPKLHEVFDNYLRMLWNIGLSVPVEYIDKHPSEITHKEFTVAYKIANSMSGKVTAIDLNDYTNLGELVGFDIDSKAIDFNVEIDKVKLFRPIKHHGLPPTQAAVKSPLLFFGSYENKFENLKNTQTGGPLSFDAYILWCPKVVPKDHNGVVLRVHNSTGTLFDETFMKYQVAEHTIKSQLVAEIFIKEGLESALNIDRESFNTSHPHYQIVTKWLHSALRQVIHQYKEVKKNTVKQNRGAHTDLVRSELQNVITSIAEERKIDPMEIRPIYFDTQESQDNQIWDAYKFDIKTVTNKIPSKFRGYNHEGIVKEKMKAIASVLDMYGLLEDMSLSEQQLLMSDLAQVIYAGQD